VGCPGVAFLPPPLKSKSTNSKKENRMSVQIIDVSNGLVTAKIAGKLTPAEQVQFQKSVADLISKEGKARVLVLAKEFQGWDKGDWSDVSFQAKYDQDIEKMAVVGEKKWADLAVLFVGKGLRQVQIEFFTDEEKARSWVVSQP
jgi:hypothetical protein